MIGWHNVIRFLYYRENIEWLKNYFFKLKNSYVAELENHQQLVDALANKNTIIPLENDIDLEGNVDMDKEMTWGVVEARMGNSYVDDFVWI